MSGPAKKEQQQLTMDNGLVVIIANYFLHRRQSTALSAICARKIGLRWEILKKGIQGHESTLCHRRQFLSSIIWWVRTLSTKVPRYANITPLFRSLDGFVTLQVPALRSTTTIEYSFELLEGPTRL
jgi:hypothetical protein